MSKNTISPEQNFSDWETIQLLEYVQDLKRKWDRRDKRTINRINQILREPDHYIEDKLTNTFLWSVTESRDSYSLWITILSSIIREQWYIKQEYKWWLKINMKDIIYRKWDSIITFDITHWLIQLWLLKERVWWIPSDERKGELKTKYPDLGWRYISFTWIWDLYENYILEKTHSYNTNKLQNDEEIRNFLKSIIS